MFPVRGTVESNLGGTSFLFSRRFTPLIELLNRMPAVSNIFRHVTEGILTEGLSHAHSSAFTSA